MLHNRSNLMMLKSSVQCSLILLLSMYAPFLVAGDPVDNPSLSKRIWHAFFGPTVNKPQVTVCPTCKNNPGSSHIDHAYLTQGNAGPSTGASSPVTINTMHGVMPVGGQG